MNSPEFRDWLPLFSALPSVILGAIFGWWANSRIQQSNRKAIVQSERKRELYQPLYQQMHHSRRRLDKDPFPIVVKSNPDDELGEHDVGYPLWIRLKRQGREPEISPNIARDLAGIAQRAIEYHTVRRDTRSQWYERGRELVRVREREKHCPLPQDCGSMLFDHMLYGNEVMEGAPRYAVDGTFPGAEINAADLLANIPNAQADIEAVQIAARAMRDAFFAAETSLDNRIRSITKQFEGD